MASYKDLFPTKDNVLGAAATPIPNGLSKGTLSASSAAFKGIGDIYKGTANKLDKVIKSDTAQALGNYSDSALRTVSNGLANSVFGKPGTGVLQEGNLSNTAKAWARGTGTAAGYGLQAYGGAAASGVISKGLQAGGAAMQAAQGAGMGAKAIRGAGAVTSFAGAHPNALNFVSTTAANTLVPASYRGYLNPIVGSFGFKNNPMGTALSAGLMYTTGKRRSAEEDLDIAGNEAATAARQDAANMQPQQPPAVGGQPQAQPAVPAGQSAQQRLSQWQTELKQYENDPGTYRQQYEARAIPYLSNAGEFSAEMFGMLSPEAQKKVINDRTVANIRKNQGVVGGALQWGKDKFGLGVDQNVLAQAQNEDKVLNQATGQYIVNSVASGGANGKLSATELNTLKAYSAGKTPEQLKELFNSDAMKGMTLDTAIKLAKSGDTSGIPPEIADAVKSGVQSNAWNWIKENPLENIPKVVGLWMHSKGWNTMGDFASNPWVFYGSLAALLFGGSMLLSGGGDDEEERAPRARGAVRPDNWAEAMYGN